MNPIPSSSYIPETTRMTCFSPPAFLLAKLGKRRHHRIDGE
jgi:hypothetical protein